MFILSQCYSLFTILVVTTLIKCLASSTFIMLPIYSLSNEVMILVAVAPLTGFSLVDQRYLAMYTIQVMLLQAGTFSQVKYLASILYKMYRCRRALHYHLILLHTLKSN